MKNVQKIEQTGKKYKGQMLLAVLLMIGGCSASMVAENERNGGIALATAGLGLLWWFGARLAAWWNHG